MKKVLALFLALMLAVSLVGCGGGDKTPPADNSGDGEGDGGDGGVVTIKLMMSQTQQPGVSAAVEAFNKAYEGKYVCEADYLAFETSLRRWRS